MFDRIKNLGKKKEVQDSSLVGIELLTFSPSNMDKFAVEISRYGSIKNGTLERIDSAVDIFSGMIKNFDSLISKELVSGGVWVRDSQLHQGLLRMQEVCKEYFVELEFIEKGEHTNSKRYILKSELITGTKEMMLKRAKGRLDSDSELSDMIREMGSSFNNFADAWNDRVHRKEELERLVKTFKGRYAMYEEIDERINALKADANTFNSSEIDRAKIEFKRVEKQRKFALSKLQEVQNSINLLFGPINGKVSEKYDYQFRFDRHTLTGFLKNNMELLENFGKFEEKVSSLERIINQNKITLDDKVREKALKTIPLIRQSIQSGELQNIIKKENGLANYLQKCDEKIGRLGESTKRLQEPATATGQKIQELVEEKEIMIKRVQKAQQEIVRYVENSYKLEIKTNAMEFVLGIGIVAVKR